MKIIGFSQLRNEKEKGNLENWFKCMIPICDYIYIYDQNSTDGSLDYYKEFDNTIVIESSTNRFEDEMICKNDLLQKIIIEHPDTDWIFWMDGDTILDNRLLINDGESFRNLCNSLKNEKYEAYKFGHKNLWRSDIYWRQDNLYNWLDENGVCALWRFRKDLKFEIKSGLHISAFPVNINKRNIKQLEYKLIHRGFSTDYQIIIKYDLYKSRGQSGWKLERFFDETTLEVYPLDDGLLPDWFVITDDVNPISKKKIIDIYNERK